MSITSYAGDFVNYAMSLSSYAGDFVEHAMSIMGYANDFFKLWHVCTGISVGNRLRVSMNNFSPEAFEGSGAVNLSSHVHESTTYS